MKTVNALYKSCQDMFEGTVTACNGSHETPSSLWPEGGGAPKYTEKKYTPSLFFYFNCVLPSDHKKMLRDQETEFSETPGTLIYREYSSARNPQKPRAYRHCLTHY